MMRKQRGRTGTNTGTSLKSTREAHPPCAVCGMADARGLLQLDLPGQAAVTLCGSHELMYRRAGSTAETVSELRLAFDNRRSAERRGGPGELDELAERLTAAFTR